MPYLVILPTDVIGSWQKILEDGLGYFPPTSVSYYYNVIFQQNNDGNMKSRMIYMIIDNKMDEKQLN